MRHVTERFFFNQEAKCIRVVGGGYAVETKQSKPRCFFKHHEAKNFFLEQIDVITFFKLL